MNYFVENYWKKYWETRYFANFFSPLLFLNRYCTKICSSCYIQEDHSCQLSHIKYNVFMINLFQPKLSLDSVINYYAFLQESKIGGLCHFNQIQKMDSVCTHYT